MSARDIIKNSVLEMENFAGTFTLKAMVSMLLVLLIAFACGALICVIYSRFYRGVVYNRSFAITLVGMTVLTAMVTLAISTNVVISLGMVGALSIVRYRTAIKEPMDIMYLFWAITTGIAAGAKMYPLLVMTFVVMFLVVALFNRKSYKGRVYIIIVHYSEEIGADMIRRAMGSVKYRIKSKVLRGSQSEMSMEVFSPNDNMVFVDKLRTIEGVSDVTIIQYDGEYHD